MELCSLFVGFLGGSWAGGGGGEVGHQSPKTPPRPQPFSTRFLWLLRGLIFAAQANGFHSRL